MYALMHWYRREPRVVLKDTLAWDPAIDVLLTGCRAASSRPTRASGGADLEAQIGELARGLDDNDAFVIFPEGGNFTPARRERAIDAAARLGPGADGPARRADEARAGAAPRRACSPRSTRRPTPTCCWSPTPGSTTC